VPAGPKVVEMLRMETGEPLAYTRPLDSSIYAKYSHYISGRGRLLTYSHFIATSQEPILCYSDASTQIMHSFALTSRPI